MPESRKKNSTPGAIRYLSQEGIAHNFWEGPFLAIVTCLEFPQKVLFFSPTADGGMAIKFKFRKVTRDIPRRDSRDNVEEVLGRKEYRGKEVKVLNLTEQHGLPEKSTI